VSPDLPETEDTEQIELGGAKAVRPQRHAFSRAGMVATQHYRATQAGVQVLREGGNAIDAAVAAAFALGVCEPQASGLGGQTMMLVHVAEPRELLALDGSSRAPNRATPESLRRSQRRRGHAATTVPSTPATLAYALKTYGTMSLQQVLQPAIELASEGFQVTELFRALTKRELKHLKARDAGAIFLRHGSRPHAVGTTLRQPALSRTLRRLAQEGIEDFYVGDIAQRIHADMQDNGGLLHADDLAQVPWPIARRPVASRFAGMRVVTFPPPGAGRVLLEMLHMLEEFPRRLWTPDTPRGALLLAEIIRRAALDRRDRPFDPGFYPQVTERRMLSRDYARRTSRSIRRRIRTSGETTHLSVMDQHGNAVALTQSIERVFGSFTMTPDLGFLYNNYMTAFEFDDIGHPYYMRPNAVPWASVAPTMVFRGRKPWLALGSPGSERIVSSVLQVFLRLLETSPYNAVASPRIHCSDAGKVSLEVSRFRDDIPRMLESKGFSIDARDPFSFYMGCVQLVVRDRRGFTGVADPRRDGSAGGPRP
jgi:gamma-glutamyltranspeptidase/glutathione hydrolase